MTSSLVGSEMCIRDRKAAVVCESVALAQGRTARASRRCSAAPLSPPVSYTHLTLPTICSV
eukprot:4113332-Prorocentrum_lima.AAC.1